MTLDEERIILVTGAKGFLGRNLVTNLLRRANTDVREFDVENTPEDLKDMLLEEKKISIDAIQKKVASHFDIRLGDMKAKKRSKAIVYPRQIAMYLARSLTDFSLPEIGEYFGGRDHTTILHAYEKIAKCAKDDAKTKELLNRLTLDIKSG